MHSSLNRLKEDIVYFKVPLPCNKNTLCKIAFFFKPQKQKVKYLSIKPLGIVESKKNKNKHFSHEINKICIVILSIYSML